LEGSNPGGTQAEGRPAEGMADMADMAEDILLEDNMDHTDRSSRIQ
jgi:hypothetical protein